MFTKYKKTTYQILHQVQKNTRHWRRISNILVLLRIPNSATKSVDSSRLRPRPNPRIFCGHKWRLGSSVRKSIFTYHVAAFKRQIQAMSSVTCYLHCVACVRLEAVLDVRCPRREDVVEWSGCRSDSAVLKARRRPIAAGWPMCPGLSGDRPRWLWPLHCCGRTACRPVVALRLCRPGTIAWDMHRHRICRPPVDKRCARRPVYISL